MKFLYTNIPFDIEKITYYFINHLQNRTHYSYTRIIDGSFSIFSQAHITKTTTSAPDTTTAVADDLDTFARLDQSVHLTLVDPTAPGWYGIRVTYSIIHVNIDCYKSEVLLPMIEQRILWQVKPFFETILIKTIFILCCVFFPDDTGVHFFWKDIRDSQKVPVAKFNHTTGNLTISMTGFYYVYGQVCTCFSFRTSRNKLFTSLQSIFTSGMSSRI